MTRNPIVLALASALLAACGGGAALLALLPIVGPIGGSWSLDGDPGTPQLEAVAGESFNLDPVDFATYLTQSRYDVSGEFSSASGACSGNNVEITGTVDADQVVLRRAGNVECLRARLVDIRTLEVSPTRRYRNQTVRVDLPQHEWINADDTTQRFKFTAADDLGDGEPPFNVATIAGCRRIGGGAPAPITGGELAGFNTLTGIGPVITGFTVAGTNFGNGEFRGASEVEFGKSGGPKLILRRVPAGATPTSC